MNYRNHFLSEIDANAVVYEFQHKGIVSDIVLQRICISYDPKQQNEILHAHLARTCTNEALMTACDIITSVKGNPRMSALGRDMQRRLESGVCMVCMCGVCPVHAILLSLTLNMTLN